MDKKYVKKIETDVLVVGAGPSGLGAAIEAARRGNDVYLLESTDRLGGIMTVCQGMPLCSGYPCQRSIGGFFQEFIDGLMAMDPPQAWIRLIPKQVFGWDVFYNQDSAIYLLNEMLEQAGVHLVLRANTGEVFMDGDKIAGVEYHDSLGTSLVQAKIYIDCSGNGDICYRAGVPYMVGDDAGKTMAGTLTFLMSNVDWEKAFPTDDKEFHMIDGSSLVEAGKVPEDCRNICYTRTVNPGQVFINWTRDRGVDGLNPDSIIEYTNKARRLIMTAVEFLKKEAPGFENAWLDGIGPLVGIRDTRRFEGMYCLTEEDIFSGRKFPESGVICCDGPLDEVGRGKDGKTTHDTIGAKNTKYYHIPFDIFVPKKVPNLFFAGRILSCDARAMTSARGMASCMNMGQAVAIGSDIAIREGCDVQKVDTRKVVDEMIKRGARGLGEENLLDIPKTNPRP